MLSPFFVPLEPPERELRLPDPFPTSTGATGRHHEAKPIP